MLNIKALTKAKKLKGRCIALRRYFHQHPELSFQEFRAAQEVEKTLRELGIETTMMANGTDVRGYLRGSKPGKNITLRSDLDALAMRKTQGFLINLATPVSWLGHDTHTAMLPAAMILSEWKNR